MSLDKVIDNVENFVLRVMYTIIERTKSSKLTLHDHKLIHLDRHPRVHIRPK